MHPECSDRYDYATTENQEVLNDRKDSAEIIYEIFTASKFNDGRFDVVPTGDDLPVIKIPKDSITEVFNYTRREFLKKKDVGPIELFIVICEFFEFDYKYVYNKVLSPQHKQDILEDLYKNDGMDKRMHVMSSLKLF